MIVQYVACPQFCTSALSYTDEELYKMYPIQVSFPDWSCTGNVLKSVQKSKHLLFEKQGYAMVLFSEQYKSLSVTTVGVQKRRETVSCSDEY